MPAGDFDYESHGGGYSAQRRPDPRIAARVLAALGSAGTVLNVGAGAGSYEPPGRRVVAVEPSPAMRAQRLPGSGVAIPAVAEALPFADASFDAAMAMVTVHQWPDADRGLRELRRVSRGPVVVLTFDGAALDRFWLADYAPELIAAEKGRYPAIEHIVAVLGSSGSGGGSGAGAAGDVVTVDAVTVEPVPIPCDCLDGFTEAYYARPERFLEPAVRQAQSAWGFVSAASAERSVSRLRAELASGEWDRRYGQLREQPEFVGSLRLITAGPTAGQPSAGATWT